MEIFLAKNGVAILSGLAFVLVYWAEHRFADRLENRKIWKHDLWNIGLGIFNRLIVPISIGFLGLAISKALAFSQKNAFGITYWLNLPFWLQIVVSLILIDVWMYWWHRINHVVPFLWKFHKYHHEDLQMNSSTAFRFHTLEIFLSNIFNFFVFLIIGVVPQTLLLFSTLLFVSIIFHHSNLRISNRIDFLLRYFVVSPGMHRIHHSKKIKETNSNYSSLFPWWDKIFGTYVHQPEKPIEFGI